MGKRILLLAIGILVLLTILFSGTFLAEADGRHYIDYEEFWKQEGRLPMKQLLDSGNTLLQSGEPERALAFYQLATSRTDGTLSKDELYLAARAFNNAGYTYFFKFSDYKEAYDKYISALSIVEENNFNTLLPFVLTNIGDIYYVYGLKDKAMDYFHRAFQASVATGENKMLLTSLNNMLIYSFDKGSTKSIDNDLKVFDSLKLNNDSDVLYTRGLVKSLRALSNGDVNRALSLLDTEVPKSSIRYIISNISIRISLLYRLGRYEDALEECNRLHAYTEMPGASDVKVGWLSSMTDIHEALGNIDSAYYYARKHILLSDSIFGKSVYGEIQDLKAARDLKTADTKFRQLQHAHTMTKIELFSAVIVVLLLVIIVIVTIAGRRRLRRRNEELFRRNSELMKVDEQAARWRKAYEQAASLPRKEIDDTPDKITTPSSQTEVPERYVELAARLSGILDENPEVYSPNFSIDDLARLAGEAKQPVSAALNRVLGKTFPQILGEVRVKKACRSLSDKTQSDRLTLEGIAESCGFRSRTNFISVFKKITGMTPSQYREMARLKTTDVSD